MRDGGRVRVKLGVGIALLAALGWPSGRVVAQSSERGRLVYERWCVDCHGEDGKGDGPAAERMLPRPRDFTAARYQVRTTGSGELPTDADLERVLEHGIPGTTMPSWPNLSSTQRADVLSYIKAFSPFFEDEVPEAMEFTSDPGGGEDAIESGRTVFGKLECAKCHGEAGRGDGPSAPSLEDWRKLPIRAADLTESWLFNGGSSVEAIHTRILTGLDGTPMPAAIDVLEGGVVTDEEIWQLAHYVANLGPREAPHVREVVRVRRTEGKVPDSPEDPAWEQAEAFYFPLVGQVIRRPRQFSPTVDGVWVQGLHDGTDLALRLVWDDPSRSPDPNWDEWQAKIAASLFADSEGIPTRPIPDAFAVQFPPEIPEGSERPYFLMGDERNPAYLWRWNSLEGGSEAWARGLANFEPLVGGGLTAKSAYEKGRWSLVLRRALDAADESELGFEQGTPIPVAFFAWDGSSGETGTRGSIGTWYYVLLEKPGSARVLLVPLLAVLLTGGLSIGLVRRAQRRFPAP
ncbi:MAG: c-type cytochrome [Gemmatimonadota bacterium]